MIAIDADVGRSYALVSGGKVFAWGQNDKGQLGNGTTTQSARPIQVPGLTGVKAIATGQYHTLALKKDGTVVAWGDNTYGQVGTGALSSKPQTSPTKVQGLPGKVIAIAAGQNGDYSMALLQDRTVWTWGRNEYGDLGNGTAQASAKPVQVKGLTTVTKIAASGGCGFGVTADGRVWAWGDNKLGQLGDNAQSDHSLVPVQVKGLRGIKLITAGGGFGLVEKTDGTLWTWGSNRVGELGNGQAAGGNSLVPVQVIAATATAAKVAGTKIGPFSTTTFLLILLAATTAVVVLGSLLRGRARRGRRRPPRVATEGPPWAADAPGAPAYAAPIGAQAPAASAVPVPAGRAWPDESTPDWAEYGRRILFLSRVDLFAGQPSDVLTRLAMALKLVDVPSGGVVVREGDLGDQFFLVEAGTLAVTRQFNGQAREFARMGPGDFFGEIALIGQGRRTATVQAASSAQLWALPVTEFREIVARNPELDAAVRRVAAQRDAGGRTGLFEVEERNLATVMTDSPQKQIRIGRSPSNEIVFESPLVSAHHAVIEPNGSTLRLRDLNSTNGTYVNGARVRVADLSDGDEIWVADERFIFDHRAIHRPVEPDGIRLDAIGVGKEVAGGKQLLNDVTLSILPGEFVAIVGGSGTGKTTLIDSLSGVQAPTSGQVLYNGRDYYRDLAFFRNVLGYVPQDDIIHTDLPLRLTLRHEARLRLPTDTSEEELDATVDKALAELELTPQADVMVRLLSGGQRKRSSIGAELLTSPKIFFLDEPTSGLDPFTDAQMMVLLRRLADSGSTVILTTHATKNVMQCDKVVFMARGGNVTFFGTPQGALRYFGAQDFDQIYQRLAEEGTPEEWRERFLSSQESRQVIAGRLASIESGADGVERQSLGDTPGAGDFRRGFHQFRVLTRRSLDLLRYNPSSLPGLIAPPILFTVLALALFHSGAYTPTANSALALQILFLLSFSAFIFGLLFAIQEIVKEFPIFRRERFVNLGILPYVMSKLAILAPLLVVMLVVMIAILRVTGRLPSSGARVYGELLLTLVLTGLVGLGLALYTSALVHTTQQATDMLSVWIMPQVLFGGALLAVRQMGIVGRILSVIAPVRWSFEELGHAVDLTQHFQTDTSRIGPGLAFEYANTFRRDPLQNWIILCFFIVVPIALTCVVLKRRTASR